MTAQIIPFPKRKRTARKQAAHIPFPLIFIGAVMALLLIQR